MKRVSRWLRKPSFWGFLGTMTVMLLWIVRPEITAQAGIAGIDLCVQVLIPTLFPFFVLTNLIVSCGYHHYVARLLQPIMAPLFKMPHVAATALTMGALGGYPMGAATTVALYDRGEIDTPTASRLLGFCNFAGPGYVFGVLGFGLFNSFWVGCALYSSHLMAGILVGISMNHRKKPEKARGKHHKIPPNQPFHNALVSAIKTAFSTALTVCGFLIFFNIVIAFFQGWHLLDYPIALLQQMGFSSQQAQGLLSGLMEMTTVVSWIRPASPDVLTLSMLGFLLGWGGLCIYFQVSALVDDRPLTMAHYTRGKVWQGLVASILTPVCYHVPLLTVSCFVGLVVFLVFWQNPLEKSKKIKYTIEKRRTTLCYSEKKSSRDVPIAPDLALSVMTKWSAEKKASSPLAPTVPDSNTTP